MASNVSPIWVIFRAAQKLSPDGYCDSHEWLEVAEEGSVGDDRTPAEPFYPAAALDIEKELVKTLEKENSDLKKELELLKNKAYTSASSNLRTNDD